MGVEKAPKTPEGWIRCGDPPLSLVIHFFFSVLIEESSTLFGRHCSRYFSHARFSISHLRELWFDATTVPPPVFPLVQRSVDVARRACDTPSRRRSRENVFSYCFRNASFAHPNVTIILLNRFRTTYLSRRGLRFPSSLEFNPRAVSRSIFRGRRRKPKNSRPTIGRNRSKHNY